MVAAAVVLVGLAVVVVLVGRAEQPSSPPEEPVAPTAPSAAGSVPLSTTVPLSEADLRAAEPIGDALFAAVAESFVFGYFTSDPQRSAGVAAEFAAQFGPGPESPTYVEWVAAESVSRNGLGQVEVDVRFRVVTMSEPVARTEGARVRVTVDTAGDEPVILGPPQLLESAMINIAEADGEAEDLVEGPAGLPVLGQE